VELQKIIEQFAFEGTMQTYRAFGAGHINKTYLLSFTGGREYVLQQINTFVFRDTDALMNNVFAVTDYLREHIAADGGDPERETLHFIRTKSGEKYVKAADGTCWRAYRFVADSVAYEKAETPALFEKSGAAFGHFQKLLRDFPADRLAETIPHFHDTPWRYHHEFAPAVQQDALGRAQHCREEIRFVQEREGKLSLITDAMADGSVPLRVTHNDTKLNNVLFDKATGKSLAVIDLDTVMPGSALYDFGDSVRYGAATAAEDETDCARVTVSLQYYEAYKRGFLREAGETLTEKEQALLPYACWLMTLECGMRFLTDYLCGDVYFKTDYPLHNLDRARNQLALAADMEKKFRLARETE